MKGFEVAFLWARAKKLDDLAILRAAHGDEFHPSDNFVETTDKPVTAHAVFQREPNRLILRLRRPLNETVSEDFLDRMAATFYRGRPYTAMPSIVIGGEVVERAYYCEDIQ